MKRKHFILALAAMLLSFAPPIFAQNVAKIGDAEYGTLSAAITAAQSGQTITLVADVNESVTIGKSLTIDGAGHTFTGKIKATTKGTYVTINNVKFDGNNKAYSYAIEAALTNGLTINNCEAKNYSTGFIYHKDGDKVTVNGATVKNTAAAFNISRSNDCKLENVTLESVTYGLHVQNYGARTYTIKNWTAIDTDYITYVQNKSTAIVTFQLEGINEFNDGQLHNSQYAKYNHNYSVAKIGEQGYETFAAAVAAAEDGQTITLVADAEESATVVLTRNLTIDGGGHTFTGAIEFKKSNGYFTVKNVNFNGAGTRVYALKSQASTTSLKVEECTVAGYTYGFLYANKAIANVTVTDVTVEDVTYGIHSAYGTNVTLNNYVAQNVEYGVMVQNYGTRKVVLNNCSFTGSENPLYIWERNQTNKITFNFQGANEMGKADYCTSAMAVVNAEAVAGTKVCGTLAEAVAAAQAGETVTLLRNAEPENYLTIDKSITLDLGEYNITRDGTALYVNGDNAEVVINGTGTVTGSQALWVANGLAKVNGGNFCGVAEAVYVTNTGKAEIYGGTFSSSNYDSFVLNKKDANRGTTDITVYGGTFVGFNPAENAAEGTGTNFVAAGLMAVDNGNGTYGIAEAAIKMGDSYYATLAEAIAAIGAGDNVIELLADATLDYNAREAYGTAETASVTINGNGHTLTLNQKNSDWSSFGLAAGKVTFNNMTIEKTGYGETSGAWNTHAIIFSSPVEMTGVTINNGIAVQDGAILNNVTINEANGYYGLWINGNGQTVTVNGGAINATNGGRGIKIADQYIDAPAQVALSVNGTAFATAKKAAVLVSSKAGAQITASNVNIENVAEDQVNFVWVDEDWAPYFAEVEVTGATVAQEGIENFVAKRENGTIYKTLAEAIAAAQAGETITLIANIEESVTIAKNLTIEGASKQYTGTMTLNKVNATIQNLNFVKGQISKSKSYNGGNVTIVNCNFDGQDMNTYAVNVARTGSVVIENVTAQNYGYGFLQLSHANNNLSIKDVKVTNTNYALKIDYSNDVTIDGLKVEDVKIAAIYNSNYGAKTYTITNSDFSGATEAIKMWERNTTVYDTFVFAGDNTLGDATLSTSPYAIYQGVVAEVGTQKFLDLNAAFAAAQNGETVTLLEDVELDEDDVITIDGMNTFCHVAADKNITFDMNEKSITVAYNGDNYLFGVFLVNGGLTVRGNGTITIPQEDRQVAYMFLKRGATGHLTIENGTFHAGNLEDSMIYTNATNVVTVKGGTFTIGHIGERENGCPWIFNTSGKNEKHINVTGGTYNWNVSKQHWSQEVKLADGLTMTKIAENLWTVAPAVAAVNEETFASVQEAIDAAQANETVTLLADATGAGVVINKSITIDFNEKTYSLNEAVGSTGTASNGFQILKGNDVTLMDGTLNVAEDAADKFYILVQNYADLTVENMNLNGTNLDKYSATDGDSYVLSNNSGEVVITGNTNITANNDGDKAFAFDACDKTAWGYTLPVVNVETTGKIAGLIESTATIAISSGIFTTPILPEWCAEYYVPVQNADGTYGVEKRYIDEVTIEDDGKVTEFVNEKEMTVGTLTYKRNFSKSGVGDWQGFYVPFEVPVSDLADLGYEVAYILDVHYEYDYDKFDIKGAPNTHIIKLNSGILRANHPYVIRPTKDADLNLVLQYTDATLFSTAENVIAVESSSTTHRFVFSGTYKTAKRAELNGSDDIPCYLINNDGEFQAIGPNVNIATFRVYLSIYKKDGSPVILDETAGSIKMRVIGEEDEDGETVIYDVEMDGEQTSDYIYDLHGRRVMEPQKDGIYIVNGKKVVF